MNRECRSRMRDLAEKKFGKVANGDVKPNAWTLLDFGEFLLALVSCRGKKYDSLCWLYAFR